MDWQVICQLFLTVSPSWRLGAGITGSIFQYGRNRYKLVIERKKIEEVHYNNEQVVLNAFIEMKNSYQQQYYVRQKQQEAACKTTRLSLDPCNREIPNYLELLHSQRELFSTELSGAQTKLELLNSCFRQNKALSGGWNNTFAE